MLISNEFADDLLLLKSSGWFGGLQQAPAAVCHKTIGKSESQGSLFVVFGELPGVLLFRGRPLAGQVQEAGCGVVWFCPLRLGGGKDGVICKYLSCCWP